MLRALVLEDDVAHAETLALALKLEGFDVVTCPTLADAEQKTLDVTYDLLIIDLDLPDGNGLTFCKEFRDHDTQATVVICSGTKDEGTVVKGFELGADDYVRKPVGVRELVARMNRFLEGPKEVRLGKLTIVPAQRKATWGNKPIHLTPREFQILIQLSKTEGQIVPRETIQQLVDRSGDATSRAIDIHVSRLRKKLKAVSGEAMDIDSKYGMGYQLRVAG